MSQEYTEDKFIKLKKLTTYPLLLEVMLLGIVAFSVFLIISLFSFSPSDPSWSQTALFEPIHNAGGHFGAWIADVMLFGFGLIAYLLPFIFIIICWRTFLVFYKKQEPHFFTLTLRIIGAITLILASCVLVEMNLNDWYHFASGGVLGGLLTRFFTLYFNHTGTTLIILTFLGAGFSFFTGWSWLMIVEKIGWLTMTVLSACVNTTRSLIKDNRQKSGSRTQQRNSTFIESMYLNNDDEDNHPYISDIYNNSDEYREVQLSLPLFLSSENDEQIESSTQAYNSVVSAQVATSNRQTRDDEGDIPFLNLTVDENPWLKDNNPRNYSGEAAQKLVTETIIPEHLLYFHRINSQQKGQAVITNNEHADIPMTEAWHRSEEESSAINLFTPYLGDDETSSIVNATGKIENSTSPYHSNVTIKPAATRRSVKELPKPNRVRIPTRRELIAYGIQLPSQRNRHEQNDASETDSITMEHLAVSQNEENRERYYDTFMPQNEDVKVQLTREVYDEKSSQYQQTEIINQTNNHDKTNHNFEQLKHSDQQEDDTCLIMEANDINNSLIHPFLTRNETPRKKPTTPLPTLALLTPPPASKEPVNMPMLQQLGKLIEARLDDYRVKAEVVGILPGPVITLFELDLAPGVKAARISNLSRDLARSLSTIAVRVVEVIPGRPYVGLELPNKYRQTVYLREVLDCEAFRNIASPLAIVLGQDISGKPVVVDLAKMPHVLVAGTTGSGKSVGVNAMIISMLYKATPDDVRFIMIDPKMLELSVYEGIPHLLTEVVTDMKDAANALNWCIGEMEKRYKLMSALGVRNLTGYNERIEQAVKMGRPVPDPFWKPGDSMELSPPLLEKLPYIVVVVDEFADLIMTVGKKIEELIARLAQKARAAGIHLVLATQRPSVDVITGLIKANIPTRIAFTVSSKIDSRTILDQSGAESLLGMGDMLYLGPNSSIPVRVHGAFVRDEEVHAVVQDWKARGKPQYIDNITASVEDNNTGTNLEDGEEFDPLYDSAVAFVIEKRKASISAVQRQFRIGYNRAARIIEQMEAQGTVSTPSHNGTREVLAPPHFD